MSELAPEGSIEHGGVSTAGGGGAAPSTHGPATAAVMLTALGVVYGDIGTSPLYAVRTAFSSAVGGLHPTPTDVFGFVSLVFWSITLIVSLKYVVLILRADNQGEGGVMALGALARQAVAARSARRGAVVLTLSILGASLFFGDSVITPAISVLSAVEGLKVVSPGLSAVVVPVAAVILGALFAVQPWGTQSVGKLFGPVMLTWFVVLGAFGAKAVVKEPGLLARLSPTYAAAFLSSRPWTGFVALSVVVLAITGAEALYADLVLRRAGP